MPTAALLATLVGSLVASRPQLAIVALVLVVVIPALTAPAAYWCVAALVSALTFKGLVTLGVLPSIATFLDIPLAWGALIVALASVRRIPAQAHTPLTLLGLLALVICVSTAFSGFDALRAVLFLALLGEPLALVCALLIAPPSSGNRELIERIFVVLLALQVPLCYLQLLHFGQGDAVQGSLYGAGAGAHVISGVAAIGALWLITVRPIGRTKSLLLAALLLPIPFIADAKQVILAFPAALLVTRWRDIRDVVVRFVAVGVAVGLLLIAVPAGATALNFLQEAREGKGGKQAALAFLWREMRSDPASIAFGKGPAQSVSRTAFMTTDELLRRDSPIRILGLSPARYASSAHTLALTTSSGGTSFNSGLSSALGVFGDLGVVGFAVYATILASLILALKRRRSADATTAAAGFAMFALLGLVFDWWEQPPFTVTLAVLAGLALSAEMRNQHRPGRSLGAT